MNSHPVLKNKHSSLSISISLLAFMLLFGLPSFGQSILNSPYSYIGMGEINSGESPNQIMMGGVGVAAANGIYINSLNPALIAVNRYTVFETGINTELKTLQDLRQKQQVFGGNYNYLQISLPATSRWTMSFGLKPFSTVQYDTKSYRRINALGLDSLIYGYNGQGNVSKLSFTNAVRVYKELYIGLEASLLFGNVTRGVSTQNLSDGQYYKVQLENRSDYADFVYKAGFAYRVKLKKDMFLNLGSTFDLSSTLKASQISRFATYDLGGLNIINADTLSKATSFTQNIPVTQRFGFTLEKQTKWSIGMDYAITNWTKVDNYLGTSPSLPTTYKVAIGGEYIPDFEAVSSYFKRVTYRAGFNYASTPYSISGNGKFAKDYNFSFGLALPLRSLSYLNLVYQIGKRGSIADNNLEEQYHRVTLGVTFNDLWFVKQRIN